MNTLKNKTILVTGGTGSFGQNFIKEILKYNPKRVVVYSRDEFKQFTMNNSENFLKFQKKLRFFIGDIRDKDRLKLAFNMKIDIVIHAAALKHVTSSEYNPIETVKTNILGAQNIIEICLEKNIEKVLALSTDKAAGPINLYGATKLVSDKLFVNANNYGSKSKFSVVRYGNVFGSRGSVIETFLKQRENGKIEITDKRMTRFNITLNQSVIFVIESLNKMLGGEIFIPKLPSYRILDLALAIAPNAKIIFSGIRPGEKIHEEMLTPTDSFNTYELKNSYIILPSNMKYLRWNIKKFKNIYKHLKPKICKEFFSYNSFENKKFLSIKEIKKLINSNL